MTIIRETIALLKGTKYLYEPPSATIPSQKILQYEICVSIADQIYTYMFTSAVVGY